MKNLKWYQAAIRDAREAGDRYEAQRLEQEARSVKRGEISERRALRTVEG